MKAKIWPWVALMISTVVIAVVVIAYQWPEEAEAPEAQTTPAEQTPPDKKEPVPIPPASSTPIEGKITGLNETKGFYGVQVTASTGQVYIIDASSLKSPAEGEICADIPASTDLPVGAEVKFLLPLNQAVESAPFLACYPESSPAYFFTLEDS